MAKAGSVVLHVLVSVEYMEATPSSGAQERDFPSSLKIHPRRYPGIPRMNQNLKKARSADSWPKSRTASNGAISCAFLESSGANTSVKCMRLDYAKMLPMGLEVEGFAEQA